MKILRLNSRGSMHLIGVLLIILVLIVALDGYKIYEHSKSKPAVAATSNTNVKSQSTASSESDNVPSQINSEASLQQTIQALNSDNINSNLNPDQLNGDLNSLL